MTIPPTPPTPSDPSIAAMPTTALSISHHPPPTSISPSPTTSAVPYRLSPAPGKGLGLFATRPISIGDLVISELPLFQPARTPEQLHAGVSALSDEDKAVFWSFTDAQNPENPTIMTIMNTNGVPFGNPAGDGGIFRLISRINHSCLPNVCWYYDVMTGKMMVRVIGDIAEGDEILVSYIRLSQDTLMRRFFLFSQFSFDCDCPACSWELIYESEYRRQKIYLVENLIARADQRKTPITVVRLAKEHTRLMDEEGLNGLMERGTDCYRVFEAAAACSDLDTARRHVRLAYGYKSLYYGSDSPFAQFMLELYDDPAVCRKTGTADKRQRVPVMCDRCGKEDGMGGGKAKKVKGGECGECHAAVYCSRKCKVAHAARHKPVCDVLRKHK